MQMLKKELLNEILLAQTRAIHERKVFETFCKSGNVMLAKMESEVTA